MCPPPEDGYEGGPELGGHEAVEDEVGGAVDEDDDLQDLAERVVAGVEELSAEDGGQHSQDSLVLKASLNRGQ